MQRWMFPFFLITMAALAGMLRAAEAPRPVIYQLMMRTFGNTNETRKPGGTLEEKRLRKIRPYQ